MNPVQHNILHNAVQPAVVLTLACIIATNRFPNLFPSVSIGGAFLGGTLATACIIGSTKFAATDESRFMSIVRISEAVALGILCASLIANHTRLSFKLSAKATFRMSIATIISLSPLWLLSSIFTPEKQAEEGDQSLPKMKNQISSPVADSEPEPTATEKPPVREWKRNPDLPSLQELFDKERCNEQEYLQRPAYKVVEYTPPTPDEVNPARKEGECLEGASKTPPNSDLNCLARKNEVFPLLKKKEVTSKVEAPQPEEEVKWTGQLEPRIQLVSSEWHEGELGDESVWARLNTFLVLLFFGRDLKEWEVDVEEGGKQVHKPGFIIKSGDRLKKSVVQLAEIAAENPINTTLVQTGLVLGSQLVQEAVQSYLDPLAAPGEPDVNGFSNPSQPELFNNLTQCS